jgi:hypothetical protein
LKRRPGNREFADWHLTASARAGITELLEPGESLADFSTWPDEHRTGWRRGTFGLTDLRGSSIILPILKEPGMSAGLRA